MNRLRCAMVMAILLIGLGLQADGPEPQTMTYEVPLQHVVTSQCLMLASDGTPTLQYSTAALEGNDLTFHDPLPQGAILSTLSVTVSTIASCQPARGLKVTLNPNVPSVDAAFKNLGSFNTTGTVSCSVPQRFTDWTLDSKFLTIPETALYQNGGDNVIRIEETGEAPCDVRIAKVTVKLRYFVSLPTIVFDSVSEDDRKVLLHKWRDDYEYISAMQTGIPQAAGRDHHVIVRGTAFNADGTLLANGTIYLRPADPPDPSPYVPSAERHRRDNAENFFYLPNSIFIWNWSPVTTDATGRFEVVLPTPTNYSGENLEIQACGVPLEWNDFVIDRCNAALGCYLSDKYTTWRRVYLEQDRMFRKGAFLREDVPAGSTRVSVTDPSPFKSRDPVAVLFIHQPGSNPASPAYYAELRHVVKVTGGRKKPTLELDQPLNNSYYALTSPIDAKRFSGDAVGVFAGTTDLFQAYPDLAVQFFKTTYVDVKPLKDGTENAMPFIPYVAACPSTPDRLDYCSDLAAAWFDGKQGNGSNDDHIHVIWANQSDDPAQAAVTILHKADRTGSYDAPQAVFVWNGLIEAAAADPNNASLGGLSLTPAISEIATHELVHTFDVNQPQADTNGHCTRPAWDAGSCLMNPARPKNERGDGVLSLHTDPWTTSEYRRIRRTREPMPLAFQDAFTPNP